MEVLDNNNSNNNNNDNNNNDDDNNSKKNNKKNMHHEIRSFSEHVQGILATIGILATSQGIFATYKEIFAAFRELHFPQHDLVLGWAINNNNDNNKNKDLFASSIFTIALRAIEKKL